MTFEFCFLKKSMIQRTPDHEVRANKLCSQKHQLCAKQYKLWRSDINFDADRFIKAKFAGSGNAATKLSTVRVNRVVTDKKPIKN
jgi:hypothetical protein